MASTPDSLPAVSEPRVTKPRRPHTKSRTGCTACKKRKIKTPFSELVCKTTTRPVSITIAIHAMDSGYVRHGTIAQLLYLNICDSQR
ncbi:hypothetical protein Neosp_001517 [[Neocosmospora] mangrovei]